ncbi:MAG: DMT family transporter [Pseudomonadota bacterium]
MSEGAVSAERADSPLRAIAYLVIGLTLFSLQDVIIKSLSGAYAVHQIVFIRGLVALFPILAIVYWEGGLERLKTATPGLNILRGLIGFTCYTTYYMALTVLPLADAVTLFYASPLFVTALSVPFLKEAVGLRRWLAVGVGFLGVVVVMQPGAGSFDPAMAFGVVAALTYAFQILLTRTLGKSQAGSTMSFHSMLVFIAASGLVGLVVGGGAYESQGHPSVQFLLRAWVWPSWVDLGLISVCGLIAGVGFYLLSQAYRLAAPSTVAPFEYSSLPWAILWGFLIWEDLPEQATLLGILLVAGSGLYIIHRETLRGRKVVRGRPLRPRI